jgi:acetyltransferase
MAEYPSHLERRRLLADGRSVLIRPIRADDEPGERQFFDCLSGETRQLRFMKFVKSLNEKLIHFFTHIDYDRHMAFVCEYQGRLVGEARYVANPGGASCEFGIVVADDWHHSGLARLLMDALTDAARRRGFERIEGLVLRDNPNMLDFVRELGFEIHAEAREPSLLRVAKRLRAGVPC